VTSGTSANTFRGGAHRLRDELGPDVDVAAVVAETLEEARQQVLREAHRSQVLGRGGLVALVMGALGGTMSGLGGAYRAVDIYFDTTDEALVATSGSGAFSGIRIRVPASAVPGRHYVTAVQRHSGRAAQARFLVNTNWAQDRYSASRSGLNPYENVLSPSNVSGLGLDWWRVASGSPVDFRSSPAVVNGVVYVGYMNGKVHALNAVTGTGK